MAKLRPTQFFNHTKEKALSSKQCVEIFTGVVFPIRAYIPWLFPVPFILRELPDNTTSVGRRKNYP